MRVLSRSERGDRPRAGRPSPQERFEELLTGAVSRILDEVAPGRAQMRVTRYTSVPYAGVRLEVVPLNPRAAPVEVAFDDVDVHIGVGSQGCRCDLTMEEALRPAALSFLQAVFRSVALGTYRETAWRRGWWLHRVEGVTNAGGRGPVLTASRARIYGIPRTGSFEPY
jgi:hypothetical protein